MAGDQNKATPPEPWTLAFTRLAQLDSVGSAVLRDDGGWQADIDFGTATTGGILAVLPGTFERVAEHYQEMSDGSGEAVDFEAESAVYACHEVRGLFAFTEHWQAGLGGSVTAFSDEAAYRAALAAAIQRCQEDPESQE
jgi:hypothetical protein